MSSTAPNNPTANFRARDWLRFAVVVLALHVPLYAYPVLRLCHWLGLSLWPTLAIFLPLFFSQIIARIWLRGHHNMIALWFRMAADLWLGISLIVLILVLIAEPVLGFSAFAPAVVAQWVIGIAAALLIYALYNALTPTVVTVPLTSAKLKKPLRQGSI